MTTPRAHVLDAIGRIVGAGYGASRSPRAPGIERIASVPPTVNDEEPARRVADAFAAYFGDDAPTAESQTVGEDMSEIPRASGAPFTYGAIGGTDPGRHAEAVRHGPVSEDVPVDHSAGSAPVLRPTPDTGVAAATVAAPARPGGRAASGHRHDPNGATGGCPGCPRTGGTRRSDEEPTGRTPMHHAPRGSPAAVIAPVPGLPLTAASVTGGGPSGGAPAPGGAARPASGTFSH
ncbi:hypothetical protein [Streptomyces caelestis]|uniref:hypothetical protein n=1 Tax=Streptomyces caelestis TaxID=36816 RepID=UPI0036538F54